MRYSKTSQPQPILVLYFLLCMAKLCEIAHRFHFPKVYPKFGLHSFICITNPVLNVISNQTIRNSSSSPFQSYRPDRSMVTNWNQQTPVPLLAYCFWETSNTISPSLTTSLSMSFSFWIVILISNPKKNSASLAFLSLKPEFYQA